MESLPSPRPGLSTQSSACQQKLPQTLPSPPLSSLLRPTPASRGFSGMGSSVPDPFTFSSPMGTSSQAGGQAYVGGVGGESLARDLRGSARLCPHPHSKASTGVDHVGTAAWS